MGPHKGSHTAIKITTEKASKIVLFPLCMQYVKILPPWERIGKNKKPTLIWDFGWLFSKGVIDTAPNSSQKNRGFPPRAGFKGILGGFNALPFPYWSSYWSVNPIFTFHGGSSVTQPFLGLTVQTQISRTVKETKTRRSTTRQMGCITTLINFVLQIILKNVGTIFLKAIYPDIYPQTLSRLC